MVRTIICCVSVVIIFLIISPFGFIAMILSLPGLRRIMTLFAYCIVQKASWVMIKIMGCTMIVQGREHIPPEGGVCFVCNHSSIVDILILLANTGRPIGFIAKKELLKVPLLNLWIFVLGGLFIDRNNLRKAMKTINTGITRIKSGGTMLIFPEGSRSRGRGLLPFRPGALKLATQSESVIVPVAIKGTYAIFEKNKRVTAGPVKLTFCAPISTTDIPPSDRKQILADRIYGVIKEALET